jgi:drug/metabolite transporter (DMT)-like permease
VCIVASVLLQAGVFGYISGRLDATASLTLSCMGFGAAAVLFNAALLVRRARRGPAAASPNARGLLALMNVVTAVTFLGFYAALSWVPSALATGIETAIGPGVLALLGLAGYGRRATRQGWAAAAVLVLLGLAIAWSFTGTGGIRLSAGTALGLALLVGAGTGAAGLALISAELGRRGIDPVYVTAHRFHLTYLCSGALLVATGGVSRRWVVEPPALLLLGVLAVTIPLFLLQAGLQRADPMVAMVLLTTLPGATYLAETVFHGGFNATSLTLICCLIAVALWSARLSRQEATGYRGRAVQQRSTATTGT